jgi:GxxExxY protein
MDPDGPYHEDQLTYHIIGCAMKVHTRLGPGLLESAYRACLVYELRHGGLEIEGEVPLSIVYGDVRLDVGYRIDIVVNKRVVLELKAVQRMEPVHQAQLISYLRLGRYPIGLLINFHVEKLRSGIKRLYNPDLPITRSQLE